MQNYQNVNPIPHSVSGKPKAHTFVAFSFCNTNNINHLIRTKYLGHRNWLFQMLSSPLNFLFNSATIKLYLHDVGLLLTLLQQFHLIKKRPHYDFRLQHAFF